LKVEIKVNYFDTLDFEMKVVNGEQVFVIKDVRDVRIVPV